MSWKHSFVVKNVSKLLRSEAQIHPNTVKVGS